MLKNKNILLGITGGIAAYKICSLIRLYKSAEANVRVVLTPNAERFVTKLTLQTLSGEDVYAGQFAEYNCKPEHISLAASDIFVIAPASANTISKLANGICDNLLLSAACAFDKPFLIAPAMNEKMWGNPFIKENLNKLKQRGFHVLEPDTGYLACGVNGKGRMREPDEIFEETDKILSGRLKGRKILITAGGTREKLDPARYISNFSSGKMGLALADSAYAQGAEVTLISTFKTDKQYKNIAAESALEMERAVKDNIAGQDCVIMAAAVADYRAAKYSPQKLKKGAEDKITIELVKNPDILKEISGTLNVTIVGFCAESENLLENAKTKIRMKGCDYIVANDISRGDTGFGSDENEVYIIDKSLNIKHIEKNSKKNVADRILEAVFE